MLHSVGISHFWDASGTKLWTELSKAGIAWGKQLPETKRLLNNTHMTRMPGKPVLLMFEGKVIGSVITVFCFVFYLFVCCCCCFIFCCFFLFVCFVCFFVFVFLEGVVLFFLLFVFFFSFFFFFFFFALSSLPLWRYGCYLWVKWLLEIGLSPLLSVSSLGYPLLVVNFTGCKSLFKDVFVPLSWHFSDMVSSGQLSKKCNSATCFA